MEKEVKRLIKESLYKRLVGHDEIDTILNNDALVEKWITGIIAFTRSVELRDENDSEILSAVQEELSFVEEGDFLLS